MATLDIITVAELANGLNLGTRDPADPAELAQVVSAGSRFVDRTVGPVIGRAVTELHDGACWDIHPRRQPVLAVTQLVEYSETAAVTLTAETNSLKPGAGYLVDVVGPRQMTIRRRSGNGDALFAWGRQNLALTYIAGRFAPVTAVANVSAGANVVTFGTAHGLAVGDIVELTGFTPTGYNASWPVLTVPSATTITIGAGLAAATAVGKIVTEDYREAATIAALHFWQHRGARSGSGRQGAPDPAFAGVPISTTSLRAKLEDLLLGEQPGTWVY